MDWQELVSRVAAEHGDAGKELIEKAHAYMKAAHEGQHRIGGVPYYTHPESVAAILVEQGYTDPELIAAALMHDVVEDTEKTLTDIEKDFNPVIALLVNGVTNVGEGDGGPRISDRYERMEATQKKVLELGKKDSRIFLIKVADRLHNLQTLEPLAPEKRQRILEHSRIFYPRIAEATKEIAFIDQLDELLRE